MFRVGEVGWIEKEDPKCGPMDAICRPVAPVPYSSDIHTVYEGGMGERHNTILDHETVGEVVGVGSIVKDFKIGDQVIVPVITLDQSSVAVRENYAMHSGVPLGGWKFSNVKDSIFAELTHVNDTDGNLAYPPERISPEAGAMLSDMVTAGLHGVKLVSIEPGDAVAVVGIGLVGLMSVANASALDTGHLFAVRLRSRCIEVTQEFGTIDVINYREGRIVGQIMEAIKGQGANRMIVAGRDPDTFQRTFDILKVGGRVANVNYLGEGEDIKISRESTVVDMGHKHLVSGLTPGGRNRMDRMVNLVLAGHARPERMIIHRFTGAEHVEGGVELVCAKPRGLIKPVTLV